MVAANTLRFQLSSSTVGRISAHVRPGLVLSRQQLLDHPNGVERGASERTIDVQVRNPRKKIEADPGRVP